MTFNHGVEGSSPSALTKQYVSSPETWVTERKTWVTVHSMLKGENLQNDQCRTTIDCIVTVISVTVILF